MDLILDEEIKRQLIERASLSEEKCHDKEFYIESSKYQGFAERFRHDYIENFIDGYKEVIYEMYSKLKAHGMPDEDIKKILKIDFYERIT